MSDRSNYVDPLSSLSTATLLFWLSVCLGVVPDALAQSHPDAPFRFIPISPAASHHTSFPTTRRQDLSASERVQALPFWDDFSQPTVDSLGFASPDTSRWATNTGVLVTTGLGIAPPTLGVASFDGAGLDGRPQVNDTTASGGLSDQLTSCPINLAVVPEAEQNSVYLSFFWQAQGRGEYPDSPGDSLRLQFSTTDSVSKWVTVWQRSGGDETLVTDEFAQEVIAVDNPAFFHDQFQFRFQSYNRQSGAFDTWNIDYVYLNKGRTATDVAYPDAALTSLPTSLFGEFTSVPMKQFRADPGRYLTAPSVSFYNLRSQPVGTTFATFVNNALTGEVLDRLTGDSLNAISPIPTAFDRRTITSEGLDVSTLDLDQDSLYLETEFYIETGDKRLIESISAAGDTTFSPDYRVNDTVRTTFVLNESLAYDDGTAEFGVELNQTGGRVAYEFVTPVADLLTHIDLHFPALPQNQGTLIQLFVWKSLGDTASRDVVLRQTGTLPVLLNNTSDGFTTYELSSPIVVQDTFYIGYQQESSDQFVVIGYDKNTNSGNRIFFNVSTEWEQNPDLRGSLMMRPRFDREIAQLVTDLSSPPQENTELVVFPNPSSGQFQIKGSFDGLRVLDILGREVVRTSSSSTSVDLMGQQPGIYLFQFNIKGTLRTRKILLMP